MSLLCEELSWTPRDDVLVPVVLVAAGCCGFCRQYGYGFGHCSFQTGDGAVPVAGHAHDLASAQPLKFGCFAHDRDGGVGHSERGLGLGPGPGHGFVTYDAQILLRSPYHGLLRCH